VARAAIHIEVLRPSDLPVLEHCASEALLLERLRVWRLDDESGFPAETAVASLRALSASG